jgi:hypothetical protein
MLAWAAVVQLDDVTNSNLLCFTTIEAEFLACSTNLDAHWIFTLLAQHKYPRGAWPHCALLAADFEVAVVCVFSPKLTLLSLEKRQIRVKFSVRQREQSKTRWTGS